MTCFELGMLTCDDDEKISVCVKAFRSSQAYKDHCKTKLMLDVRPIDDLIGT